MKFIILKSLFFFFLLLLFSACNEHVLEGKHPNSDHSIGKIINLSKTDREDWIQEHSIMVNGSLEMIWDLYTNPQQMKTHVAPIMEVEFKNGGKWEASYDLNAKIGDSANFLNEIVNIIPYRQFTTKGVRAPFDTEAMESLRSTMLFENFGNNKVKVNAITTGWSGISDVAYRRKVFDMAGQTNPEILRCLNLRLTQGPLNWEKILNSNND